MFTARNLQKQCFKTLSSLTINNPFKDLLLQRDVSLSIDVIRPSFPAKADSFSSIKHSLNRCDGSRAMSTGGKGKSMRSRVESRMRKESGKTLREIRRAKKLQKKLMTDEERLIYNLRRAKKKVALLLQKLKKYELPELPPSRHDPELFTPEQIQAYKKIGFKNRNYVPVGVRGVFGGVVQNMHMHWKFHETVQVCCDNFPKEKIKEMATMLAKLSGGIVINVHNVKTIIMFRGRNYRQPKNLIPINTLTKRKALFKARFEQALESQKLNIKKIEQELRRKGVNPDDPVALASIQRVASTFFNAVDKKDGSPYVFREDKLWEPKPSINLQQSREDEDSEQEELDRFIAEIEDAADKEWAEEEAAEKEELSMIRYRNMRGDDGRFRRSEMLRGEDFDHSNDEADNISEDDEEWGSDDDANRGRNNFRGPILQRGNNNGMRRGISNEGPKKAKLRESLAEKDSGSEDMLSDVEDAMWQSDSEEEEDLKVTRYDHKRNSEASKINSGANFRGKIAGEMYDSEDPSSDSEIAMWESDAEEVLESETSGLETYGSQSNNREDENRVNEKKKKSPKQVDETWDSD